MTMNAEVLDSLLAAKRNATCAVHGVEQAKREGMLTPDLLKDSLNVYIRAKYRLDEGECASDDLEALAEASLAKMLRVAPELVAESDTAANCDGADSVTVKQALLMMAIQKDFGVRLDGFRVAFASTTGDLAGLVYEQLAVAA